MCDVCVVYLRSTCKYGVGFLAARGDEDEGALGEGVCVLDCDLHCADSDLVACRKNEWVIM